jgi:phage shock protein E
MLKKLRAMLGLEPQADFRGLMKAGAQIIDVRSRGEFAEGHLKGSVNIPLSEIIKSMGKISKSKPVIVCCASGMRSASAKSLLKQRGYDVHNGGGWQSLQHKIK